MIFPVGDFKYVWAEDVDDLYGDIEFNNNFQRAEDQRLAIWDFMDDQNYQTDHLDRAMDTHAEIILKCSKYYAIPEKYQSIVEDVMNIDKHEKAKT
jgi:hypothetical protein